MYSFPLFALLASSITGSSAAMIKVQVGKNSTGGLATVFNPNQVTAQVGDTIQFEFMGKNHSVTQSSFAEPCTRQLNTALNLPGADSGFTPVAANATEIPTWTIQVNDASSPQWFFCNQAQHCNAGMVFSINAPAIGEKSFDAYLAKAKNATHPDPALNVTAPFTPPASASPIDPSASSSDPLVSSTSDPLASTTSDPLASATEVPGNVAPGVSGSSSASSTSVSSGGLSFSSGGTAAADNVSGTTSASALSSSSTARNSGDRVKIGSAHLLVVALGALGALAL